MENLGMVVASAVASAAANADAAWKKNNENLIKNLIAKANMVGWNVYTAITPESSNKIHVIDGNGLAIVYIPDGVTRCYLQVRTLLNKVYRNRKQATGSWKNFINLKMIGGSDLNTIENLFSHLTINVLDLSKFDTSSVTDMCTLFLGSTINDIKFGGKFNTSKVKYINCMFEDAQFNGKVLDLSSFDMHNVEQARGMFANFSVNEIKIGNWDLSKNTNFERMFSECEIKGDLDLRGLKNLCKTYKTKSIKGSSIVEEVYFREMLIMCLIHGNLDMRGVNIARDAVASKLLRFADIRGKMLCDADSRIEFEYKYRSLNDKGYEEELKKFLRG